MDLRVLDVHDPTTDCDGTLCETCGCCWHTPADGGCLNECRDATCGCYEGQWVR